ncbi:hypothetical protein [Streptomyces spiramenti]|uniref:Uncharacterized protein n=1 Tax=Streptomyces spiramenti TaxID=2720606 RepID=A0ABX1AH41_9ACTN|nr:hypothetical protein [Streptomyces spiramenti]NJP66464.1 hypothetical protein [Streptomyces spiramenti]
MPARPPLAAPVHACRRLPTPARDGAAAVGSGALAGADRARLAARHSVPRAAVRSVAFSVMILADDL